MRNLIYQFWDTMGKKRVDLPGVKASWKNVKQYAARIGAGHMTETNPPRLHGMECALYYGSLNPVFREEFHDYDNVLFLDSDVHPVEGLEESIFDGFDADIGICADHLTAKLRAQTKEGKINRQQDDLWAKETEKRWGVTLPRTPEGFLKIYNSGVILYSKSGMARAQESFIPFAEYINFSLSVKGLLPFYAADQNYLHAALFASKINFTELDDGWNTLITVHERNDRRVIFDRNNATKFVHPMGIAGVHHWDEKQIWKMTNLPVDQWGQGRKDVTSQIKLNG